MVQDFGVLLSIGIVALLIAGIVVPTTLIGGRERRSPTTEGPRRELGRGDRRPARAACRGSRCCRWCSLRSCCRCLASCWRRGSKIESDPINWANQSSTSIKNARTLEKETGFATTLGVFVETDERAVQRRVHRPDGRVRVRPRRTARRARTPSSPARRAWRRPSAGWPRCRTPRRCHRPVSTCCEAYNVAPSALHGLLVADNGNATQVLFQVGPSSLEQRAAVLDNVHLADRRSRRRRAAAGTGVGHHRRPRRRRRRTAREHHRQPRATDDRGAAARRRVRRASLSRPGSWAADDDPGARRGRHLGGARAECSTSRSARCPPSADRWSSQRARSSRCC